MLPACSGQSSLSRYFMLTNQSILMYKCKRITHHAQESSDSPSHTTLVSSGTTTSRYRHPSSISAGAEVSQGSMAMP
eukprot:1159047-Pelagomonas_calceolata.AAC.5